MVCGDDATQVDRGLLLSQKNREALSLVMAGMDLENIMRSLVSPQVTLIDTDSRVVAGEGVEGEGSNMVTGDDVTGWWAQGHPQTMRHREDA